jgi:hypothetical protein
MAPAAFAWLAANAAAITAGAAVAGAATAAYSANEGSKARKSASAQSALDRQAMADLQGEPEISIPTADDASVRRARHRSIAGMQRRRGRQSTILTGDSVGAGLGG